MTNKKARWLTVAAAATAALALALGGVALCSAAEISDNSIGGAVSGRLADSSPSDNGAGAGESIVSAVVAAIVAVAVILVIIALMPRKRENGTE